jgi:hypothetical protein
MSTGQRGRAASRAGGNPAGRVESRAAGRVESHAVGRVGSRAVGRVGSRAVGSYLPQLTRKVFEKYGFSRADIFTEWPAIVGTEMAAYTAPERMRWPRQGDAGQGEGGVGDTGASPRGATLVLRVDGGRALDVQYQARQIIERINSHFGYRAVTELRFVQAPLEARPSRQHVPLPRDVVARHKPEIPEIQDEALRAALERLGASLLAEKSQRNGRS